MITKFSKWRNLCEQFKLKEFLGKKNLNPRPTFLNDRVFYLKKQPKSEIKIIKKDLKNLKSFALISLIKTISNILLHKNSHFTAKSKFLNNFIQKLKLKMTFKNYGQNYKKIFNHVGINNFSNKKKNIFLIRDSYKKYFTLLKIFIQIEKYNHKFSRYLKYSEHKIYIQGKLFNENLKNSLAPNLLEEKNSENFSNKKIQKFLNFQNVKEAGLFKRKKLEALETLYANLQLNIYFTKWKLFMHKRIKEKIFNKKILQNFIENIEKILLKKLGKENSGNFFPSENLKDEKVNYFNCNEKILLSKMDFFKKFLWKFSFKENEKNFILKNFVKKFQIIFCVKNIFEKKIKFFNGIFMRNFKINQFEKQKNLDKLKKLKIIFELVRLSNEKKIGKNKNLVDFVNNYYTQRNFIQNTLAINFSKWKKKILQFLNRAKFNEKFKFQSYYNDQEINNNNKNNIKNEDYFSLSAKGIKIYLNFY